MDFLSPELLWIEDRCYRLSPLDTNTSEEERNNFRSCEWTDNDSDFKCKQDFSMESENEDDDELMIQMVSENRFKLLLPIAQTFWPKIIGSKGVTKKRIETDTKTKIIIPKPMEHGNIEVRGSSKRDIILAKRCIDDIVSSSRKKLEFTHFISIPMTSSEIKINFLKFKEEVLALYGSNRGIEESIFQSPDKLHLTIAVLVLTDQNERSIAETKLKEACDKFVRPLLQNISNKLVVEVRGIEYMNDDPSQVNVLYGKISPGTSQRILQKIADSILQYFTLHKLIKIENKENVKLHVTLMNTSFKNEDPEEMNVEMTGLSNKKFKKIRSTFNATDILKTFQDFYFGLQEIKTIDLSLRYSTSKDGYYKSSGFVNLLQ